MRRSPTTGAAAVLLAVLSVLFAAQAVGIAVALVAFDPNSALGRGLLFSPIGTAEGQTLMGIGAGLMLVCSGIGITCAAGIAARRQWARHGALFLCTSLGLVVLALSVAGLAAPGPSAGPLRGIAVAVADLAVVGLLLSPSTAEDIDRAEWRRSREFAARTAHRRDAGLRGPGSGR